MLVVISLSTRSVLFFLIACIGVLIGMDALLLFVKFGLGHESIYGLTNLFDLDTEQNIPTLFSTLDLVLAAGLLWLHYRESSAKHRPDAVYWFGLCIIFAFLAFDEFGSLHERLMKPTEHLLHTSGALRYAWVVPYGLLVLVFSAAYFRFWWRLPVRNRALIGTAGVIYVGGAIAMEMVGAKLDSIYGWHQSLAAGIAVIFEEGMEMSGVALFVYALLELLRDRGVTMRFKPDAAELNNAELTDDALSGARRDRNVA